MSEPGQPYTLTIAKSAARALKQNLPEKVAAAEALAKEKAAQDAAEAAAAKAAAEASAADAKAE